jgi:hypothetical protein
MDKDEALKLAYEALEATTTAQNKLAASKHAEWLWLKTKVLSHKEEEELKDAYYAAEKEAAAVARRRDSLSVEAITAVKKALAAQPAPVQPVADAWMHKDGRMTDAKAKTARAENFHGWRPMAFIASTTPPAQPAPVQEPWGFHIQFNNGKDATFKGLNHLAECEAHLESGETITMIYTTPPAAPVPLTDEQIDVLRESKSKGRGAGWRFDFKGFARAIEAAHGITKGQP